MKKRLISALMISLLVVLTLSLSGCGRVHRVIYDGNGHTGGAVPVDIQEYSPGQMVTVFGNSGGLVRSRYVFAGWNTQADGYGETYVEGQTFPMGTKDLTLYAKWMYRVAYIYKSADSSDATAAAAFEALLDPVYPADLIDMSQIATADFSQYSIIIIGRRVGILTTAQATTIRDTNLPVIGIHGGGMGYFELIGSYMIWGHTASDLDATGAVVINAAQSIWNFPNAMNVTSGATVTLFTSATQASVLYIGSAPSDVLHIARASSSYDTIAIQGRNLYWAYYNDASCFTQDGQKLFINAINHMMTN